MTNEDWKKRYDHLISRVSAMRLAQIDYFDGRKRGYTEPNKLQKSKSLEQEVDRYIKNHNEAKAKQQGELF